MYCRLEPRLMSHYCFIPFIYFSVHHTRANIHVVLFTLTHPYASWRRLRHFNRQETTLNLASRVLWNLLFDEWFMCAGNIKPAHSLCSQTNLAVVLQVQGHSVEGWGLLTRALWWCNKTNTLTSWSKINEDTRGSGICFISNNRLYSRHRLACVCIHLLWQLVVGNLYCRD